MNICLKASSKQSTPSHVQLVLDDRLPHWIQSPCTVACTYDVTATHGYYVLNIEVSGALEITCQRCLAQVSQAYQHQVQLAVCATEARAERLMESYDCVIALDDQIDLCDILIGEMYLNVSERPHELADCHLDVALFT